MNSKYWKVVAVVAVAAVLLLTVRRGAAAHSEDWDRDGRVLEGTWAVTITQVACPNGPAVASPFQSLLTFDRGGTMTETTANPMFVQPVFRGPGHGVWSHTGLRTYSSDMDAFITVNGTLAKIQKISQTIEMGDDPNTFTTSEASVQFFDPTATVLLGSGCATATGQRIE